MATKPVFRDITTKPITPKLKWKDISPKKKKIIKWKNIETSSYLEDNDGGSARKTEVF